MKETCRPSAQRAFTLLELLVVVVIISITLSILGLATAEPDMGRKLERGAHFLGGKVRETRSVAAMRLSNARLLVHMNAAQPELMLQSFVIVVETETGSGVWEPVGDPQKLPPGVCWVPPAGVNDGWAGPRSTGGKPAQIEQRVGAWLQGSSCWAYEFTPAARIESRRYDLILAEGSTVGGAAIFRNSQNFRGLHVNAYGHVSEIADMAQIR